MKRLKTILPILILLAALTLNSCAGWGSDKRAEETIEWLEKAKKPIKVYSHNAFYNALDELIYTYTFVDSAGNMYHAKNIDIELTEEKINDKN